MKFQNLLLIFIFSGYMAQAQISTNEDVKKVVNANVDTSKYTTQCIINLFKQKDQQKIYNDLTDLIENSKLVNPDGSPLSAEVSAFCNNMKVFFKELNNKENNAFIVLYRTMTFDANDYKPMIDFESMNTLVFNKYRSGDKWNEYLLNTKKIVLLLIDFDDVWYQANRSNLDKKLSNSTVKIVKQKSFLSQSLKDLRQIAGMGGADAKASTEIKFTLVEINPQRVKDPCQVVVQNKSFKNDITFQIHEVNYASFQVGVVNDKIRANNISISGNNLVVKPDDTQKEQWKSNLFAAFEFHPFGYNAPWGRDIDNFNPLWKDLFSKKRDTSVKLRGLKWLSDITIARVGIYGGLKINKDPLSSLHAGFNYALTKDVYINFGWVWTNEVVPQVTEIGNISSVDDALKYAKRSYSSGKLSWGLSFSPTSVAEMLNIGKKDSK